MVSGRSRLEKMLVKQFSKEYQMIQKEILGALVLFTEIYFDFTIFPSFLSFISPTLAS